MSFLQINATSDLYLKHFELHALLLIRILFTLDII